MMKTLRFTAQFSVFSMNLWRIFINAWLADTSEWAPFNQAMRSIKAIRGKAHTSDMFLFWLFFIMPVGSFDQSLNWMGQ